MSTRGLLGIGKKELVFMAVAIIWTANVHTSRNVVSEAIVQL